VTTREQGIAAIKAHEGLRLQAYPDPGSGGEPWTIGWGHTGGVKRGDVITLEQAEKFLAEDIAEAQAGIRALVKVPLTDGQLWALTSFVFNLGTGALAKSTLLRRLNARDYAGAASEFGRWINAAGKPMPGLVRRRAEEKAMFLSGGSLYKSPEPVQKTPENAHVKEAPVALPAILAALLPSLIQVVPKLGKMFGSGSDVSERNVAAVTMAMDVAKEALGAKSAQEAIETALADPEAAQQVRQAIESRWLELSEAGGDGIAGARAAALAYSQPDGPRFWFNPAFWVSMVLLTMPVMLLVDVFYVHPEAYVGEIRTQIVTGILLVIGMVGGYWIGTSFSSARKTEIAANERQS
jgi:GH24 family phage-related lysozyme (muramidase)